MGGNGPNRDGKGQSKSHDQAQGAIRGLAWHANLLVLEPGRFRRGDHRKSDGAISTEIGERTLMRPEPGFAAGNPAFLADEATSVDNSADCKNKELTSNTIESS
jgi:hypothetical protein